MILFFLPEGITRTGKEYGFLNQTDRKIYAGGIHFICNRSDKSIF